MLIGWIEDHGTGLSGRFKGTAMLSETSHNKFLGEVIAGLNQEI